MADYLVRVKPYNPKRRAFTQRCTYRGKRFEADRGWYRISGRRISEEISEIKDSKGNYIFEVKTVKEVRTEIRKENLDPSSAEAVASDEFRKAEDVKDVYLDEAEEDLEPEPEPEPELEDEPDEEEIGVVEDLPKPKAKPKAKRVPRKVSKKAGKTASKRRSESV